MVIVEGNLKSDKKCLDYANCIKEQENHPVNKKKLDSSMKSKQYIIGVNYGEEKVYWSV